ncbi:enoyl-CoA hydratase/isomerase [Flavobacterium sp. H122]|uniref:enoyl-CoA hydratase/isomerase n=1 Tax=Flavobacterium sp. H122 TaxID=2529860 RepID=UPI0010AA81DF|nr:enoyl-CoA hydratase/isomerase [Flavobacterium sp. H122]
MENIITNFYKNIKVSEQRNIITIQLYRPEANNSINGFLIKELMMVLVQIESNPEIKVVVLEGLPDVFCSGMDFKTIYKNDSESLIGDDPNKYYDLLKHFSLCSKIIVAKVEGKVNAGGIGLVAVSDIVIADEKATFGLSEVLFGLLPACVIPFLIRRVGYQKAQWMTLISQGISAERAHQIGLVDEVSTNVNEVVRKNLLRLTKLETDTIKDLKDYMSKLWIINQQTQQLAVDKIYSLLNTEKVQTNISNFVENGKFPWDK